MKTIREFDAMNMMEQESFISHAGADLVHKLYYENDRKGLEVLVKNLTLVIDRAKDCIDCLDMLRREGDVFTKLYLLLEYMGKDGISEEVALGLEKLIDRAQFLAQSSEAAPTAEEEREVVKQLNSVMTQHEIQANHEMQKNAQSVTAKTPGMTKNSAAGNSALTKNVSAALQGTAERAVAV